MKRARRTGSKPRHPPNMIPTTTGDGLITGSYIDHSDGTITVYAPNGREKLARIGSGTAERRASLVLGELMGSHANPGRTRIPVRADSISEINDLIATNATHQTFSVGDVIVVPSQFWTGARIDEREKFAGLCAANQLTPKHAYVGSRQPFVERD